jgi:D-cysteine desulfhydrase
MAGVTATGMAGVPATFSSATAQIGGFLSKKPYAPPLWATHLSPMPCHTFSLGHVRFRSPSIPTLLLDRYSLYPLFQISYKLLVDLDAVFELITFVWLVNHTFKSKQFPTPIHKWNLPNLPEGTEVWIKVQQ